MKIYIATPVNGRREKTLRVKLEAACMRVAIMLAYLCKWHEDAEFMSVFDIGTPKELEMLAEPLIMGQCVEMVIEADMIVLDDGWESSRGCTIERYVAMQYGKQIRTINWFKLQEILSKVTEIKAQ